MKNDNNYNNSYLVNNFEIKGYILDEDTIKRKINGEYINLLYPINGYYSNMLKVGLLEVNKNKLYNNTNYLLIEITNRETNYINSYMLVELIIKESYQEIFFMPINQYLIETFDSNNGTFRDKNKYHIFANQRGKSQILIEISPEYNDIDLIFTNDIDSTSFKCSDFNCTVKIVPGFKRYIIYDVDSNNIYFNVINAGKRKANYMIRYYYSDEEQEINYQLSNYMDKEYIDTNDDKITLSLTFDLYK